VRCESGGDLRRRAGAGSALGVSIRSVDNAFSTPTVGLVTDYSAAKAALLNVSKALSKSSG
jgi:hypothetical protein